MFKDIVFLLLSIHIVPSTKIIIKKIIMKRLFYVVLIVTFCSSCHRSLEDRAAQECKDILF